MQFKIETVGNTTTFIDAEGNARYLVELNTESKWDAMDCGFSGRGLATFDTWRKAFQWAMDNFTFEMRNEAMDNLDLCPDALTPGA